MTVLEHFHPVDRLLFLIEYQRLRLMRWAQ